MSLFSIQIYSFLFKIGILENSKCSFCNEAIETMKHLMWKCKHVASFWREVTHWLRDFNIILNVTYMKICLGIYDTDYSTFVKIFFK